MIEPPGAPLDRADTFDLLITTVVKYLSCRPDHPWTDVSCCFFYLGACLSPPEVLLFTPLACYNGKSGHNINF